MKKESEFALQQQFFQWIHNEYCRPNQEIQLICHCNTNGIGLTFSESEYLKAKLPKPFLSMFRSFFQKTIEKNVHILKLIGLVAGVSDLLVHGKNGRCLHIEMKTSAGKQSTEQIKMQSKIQNLNGKYIVVRGFLEGKILFKENLNWLYGID
jgi:hypothetical protein